MEMNEQECKTTDEILSSIREAEQLVYQIVDHQDRVIKALRTDRIALIVLVLSELLIIWSLL